MERIDFEDPKLVEHFVTAKTIKPGNRPLALSKRLKALTPEKLAEIEKLISATQESK
jgi:hypothetical protein